MTDREKVIKGLKYCMHTDGTPCSICPYLSETDCVEVLNADAFELLKEQEERIGALTRAIEQMPKPTKLLDVFGDGYAKVIRCKDCKYCEYPDAEKEWCKKGHLHGNAETWFCADGERKCNGND